MAAAAAGLGSAAVFWVDRLTAALVSDRLRQSKLGWRVWRLGEAVGAYRAHPGVLGHVLVLSLAVQFVRILQAYGLGRGLVLGVGVDYSLVFMPVAMLVLVLPVSISGLGLPQAAIVWLLAPVGVPVERAFALSTLLVVIGLLGNLPGAFLYLVRRKPVT